MSSLKQIEANRRNAQKSTGPNTPGGKARVRFNGLKHGLRAESLILPHENAEEYGALRGALESEWNAESVTERMLINQMAESWWRMQRVNIAEREQFCANKASYDKSADRYGDPRKTPDEVTYQIQTGDTLPKLLQHHARLTRAFSRAMNDLIRLQKTRPVPEPEEDVPQPVELAVCPPDREVVPAVLPSDTPRATPLETPTTATKSAAPVSEISARSRERSEQAPDSRPRERSEQAPARNARPTVHTFDNASPPSVS